MNFLHEEYRLFIEEQRFRQSWWAVAKNWSWWSKNQIWIRGTQTLHVCLEEVKVFQDERNLLPDKYNRRKGKDPDCLFELLKMWGGGQRTKYGLEGRLNEDINVFQDVTWRRQLTEVQRPRQSLRVVCPRAWQWVSRPPRRRRQCSPAPKI